MKPQSKLYFNSSVLTRRAILSISLTVVLSPILASATEPSPKTHIYVIDYKKPVPGAETVNMLNVTFFVKVTPQQAESVLRTELDRIRKLFPPEGDALAIAWFSPTGNEVDEEQISLSDGSTLSLHKFRLPGDLRQLAKLRGNATSLLGPPDWRTY